MKKFNLLALSIFAVALWSCTDKNDLGGSNVPDGDVVTNYLSVSIVPTMDTGTRADDPNEEGNTGVYKDGSAVENYVKNVRFYFFDANGKSQAVKRKGDKWLTYHHVDAPDMGEGESENVEKVINTMVVLASPNGDLVPASLVAIVNCDETLFDNSDNGGVESITDLLKKTGTFAKPKYGEEEGILMSSAVYMDNGGTIVVEKKLKPEDFGQSEAEAEKKPVTIYVERAVAKVSLNTDNFPAAKTIGEGINKQFKLTTTVTVTPEEGAPKEEDGDLKIQGVPGLDVYVKFLGWNVTQIVDKSFALKNLAADWTYDGTTAPFAGWSYAPYFRSFWALNPALDDENYHYTDFNGSYPETPKPGEEPKANVPSGQAIKGISDTEAAKPGGEPNYTYAPENAPQTKNEKRTEVLVAAQLVDVNGDPIQLAEFNGFKFAGKDYQTNLLQAVANMIGVWQVIEDPASQTTTYKSIEGDLELVSAREAGMYDETGEEAPNKGSFYTYVRLKEDEETKTHKYVDNDDKNGQPVERQTINENLLADTFPYIKVWTNGYTYYFVDIEHLNKSEDETNNYPVGKYGVVRNHWYAIDVTKVFGLGTPVFDPSEKIIPENPYGHESYLAAKINILSWRLVRQSTVLGQ